MLTIVCLWAYFTESGLSTPELRYEEGREGAATLLYEERREGFPIRNVVREEGWWRRHRSGGRLDRLVRVLSGLAAETSAATLGYSLGRHPSGMACGQYDYGYGSLRGNVVLENRFGGLCVCVCVGGSGSFPLNEPVSSSAVTRCPQLSGTETSENCIIMCGPVCSAVQCIFLPSSLPQWMWYSFAVKTFEFDFSPLSSH